MLRLPKVLLPERLLLEADAVRLSGDMLLVRRLLSQAAAVRLPRDLLLVRRLLRQDLVPSPLVPRPRLHVRPAGSLLPKVRRAARLLDPLGEILTPDVARKLVKLRFDAKAQARIAKLAGKCNEGDLTESERREYEAYAHAIDFISILQAKARALLKRSGEKI